MTNHDEDINLDENVILYDLCLVIILKIWLITHSTEDFDKIKEKDELNRIMKALLFFIREK